MTDVIYRFLLRLFPRSFRNTFGADMLHLFGERAVDSAAHGGSLGLFRHWCRTLEDIVVHAFLEHAYVIRRRFRHGGGFMLPGPDLGRALRGFRTSRAFAIAVVLITGVGIGATTTIFSVVDHVLLRPLPYPDSEALFTIGKSGSGISIPDFVDVRDRTSMFESLGAQWDREQDLTGGGNPERVNVGQLTRGFLTALGARVDVGRLFVPSDFDSGAERTAVLSYAFWQRRWGSDAGSIGGTISLDGQSYQIVGILSRDFERPEALTQNPVDVWVPLDPPQALLSARRASMLRVVARLANGRNAEEVQQELDALASALAEQYPTANRRSDGSPAPLILRSLHEATVGHATQALSVLLGAVGLMLLIACANVANLTLARGNERAGELALRSALGASRARLVGLLLTESVILGGCGGAVGVVLSSLGVKVVAVLNAGDLPRVTALAVDWRIVTFALALSIAASLLFGLVPAFRSARSDISSVVNERSVTRAGARNPNTGRDALVVTEIALALMLLVGAGLLFNSFLHLRRVDPGFNAENVMTFGLRFGLPFGWSNTRYGDVEAKRMLTDEVLAAVRDAPGVVEVGGGLSLPFATDHFFGSEVVRNDKPNDTVQTWIRPVTNGYLEALDVRLVAGRTFTASEERSAEPMPALINNTLARRLWGETSPLGAELVGGNMRVRVVGVLEDLSHLGLDHPTERNLYLPYLRVGTQFDRLDVAVRYRGSTAAAAAALRAAVWSVDPDLPIGAMLTMRQRLARSLNPPRFYSLLFSSFAGVAILLAASGIFASMMYAVGRRRRELGIRLALGGTPSALVRLVLKRGVLLTGAGIILGLGGSLVLSRMLDSFLFGITSTDAITFVTVSLLLSGIAVFACFLPGRRAANADPLEALRTE